MSMQNETAGALPGIFILTHVGEYDKTVEVQVVTLARRIGDNTSLVVYRDVHYNVWVEEIRTFRLKFTESKR